MKNGFLSREWLDGQGNEVRGELGEGWQGGDDNILSDIEGSRVRRGIESNLASVSPENWCMGLNDMRVDMQENEGRGTSAGRKGV